MFRHLKLRTFSLSAGGSITEPWYRVVWIRDFNKSRATRRQSTISWPLGEVLFNGKMK